MFSLRNLGISRPQQFKSQVLIIRYIEIRIKLLILVDCGKFHRISLSTDVSPIGIFCQICYAIHWRFDVTIAQIDASRFQLRLGLAYRRLTRLYITFRLHQLDATHRITLDGLLHAFIIALRIIQTRLRCFQIRFRLFNRILIQSRIYHKQGLPFLHPSSRGIKLGKQRTIHSSYDIHTVFGGKVTGIIPGKCHILHNRFCHFYGKSLHLCRTFFFATSGQQPSGQDDDKVYPCFHTHIDFCYHPPPNA